MTSQDMLALYLTFGALWFLTCLYAWAYGGWEGRWLSTMLVLAAVISPFAQFHHSKNWIEPQYGVFAIDLALLIGMTTVAYRTDRYWPLWMLAFHLLSVLTHVVVMLDQQVFARAYQSAAAFWSIPIQLIMALGVMLNRRAKNTFGESDGREFSQSEQSID